MRSFDVIVLGAGAAGLMCALVAGARGRSVLVIERNDAPGKKILISGGGRCNFTNLDAVAENFISANPHFARSALARFTPADFIAMVESHRIAYHQKKLGQLFCDGSARAVLDMLLAECANAGVVIETGCEVASVAAGSGGGFTVDSNRGSFSSTALVVATGGLSVPKIGATSLGYDLARQFGLPVLEPRPGLVPLTFAGEERDFFAALAGVSLDTVVSAAGAAFRENILFTHRGLSGPAILQASSYWKAGTSLAIDLLPALDGETLSDNRDARDMATVLSDHLPRRFAQGWSERHAPPGPFNRLVPGQRSELMDVLHRWELRPAGTEGFARAEVTVGGVDTAALSSKTMEARTMPGLFFIGEVVDVTGWLGGFNFQWAWSSGFAAGQAV